MQDVSQLWMERLLMAGRILETTKDGLTIRYHLDEPVYFRLSQEEALLLINQLKQWSPLSNRFCAQFTHQSEVINKILQELE